MFKNKILLAACILSGSVAIAQTTPKKKTPVAKAPQVVTVAAPVVEDPIMLIVGGDAVTRAEFESIYRKNNSKDTVSSRKALEEYLQLFINFNTLCNQSRPYGPPGNGAIEPPGPYMVPYSRLRRFMVMHRYVPPI